MIYAEIDILATLLLLFDKTGGQATTTGVNDGAALLPFDGGMEAEVLSTGQAETSEFFFVTELLGPVLHEGLQLGQGFLDLGHGTGAIDEFPFFGVILLVCNDQRQ